MKTNFVVKMRSSGKKRVKTPIRGTKREARISCLLSAEEEQFVARYLDKYQITNKSRWLRETILMFIHKKMEEDYPTLFDEHDMRR